MAALAESSWIFCGHEFTHVASSFFFFFFSLDHLALLTSGYFLAECCNVMDAFRVLIVSDHVLAVWTELLVPLRTCKDGVWAWETGCQVGKSEGLPFSPWELLVGKKTLQLCWHLIKPSPALGSQIIEAQWTNSNFLELICEVISMTSGKLSLEPPR